MSNHRQRRFRSRNRYVQIGYQRRAPVGHPVIRQLIRRHRHLCPPQRNDFSGFTPDSTRPHCNSNMKSVSFNGTVIARFRETTTKTRSRRLGRHLNDIGYEERADKAQRQIIVACPLIQYPNGLVMEFPDKTSHAFVIHVWLEEPARADSPALWRGSVTNVLDKRKIYFQDLNDLLAFLKPYIEQLTELNSKL
jgi:hypothetical protein